MDMLIEEDVVVNLRLIKKQRAENKFLDHSIPYTPKSLIAEISKNFEHLDKEVSIAVLYTIEWAVYLLSKGYQDITLITKESDERVARWADMMGVKHELLDNVVHSIKERSRMKFDVVVGNPPYQLGRNRYFYQEFVIKSWEISNNIVAMITPSNWTSLTKIKSTFTKKVLKNGLVVYKFLGDRSFVNVQLLVVYFVTSKLSTNSEVTLINEFGNLIVERSSIKYFPTESGKGTSIIEKLQEYCLSGHLKEIHGTLTRGRAQPSNSADSVKCIYSAGYKNQDFDWEAIRPTSEIVGNGYHKVIVTHQTSVGRLGELKYAGPEYGIGLSAHAFIINDTTEADNLIKYLETPLIRFIIKTLKGAVSSNSQTLFGNIPSIDLSKSWTDAELYAHFNLTQEEIDYIEATVK
jgi:site-specific DNA-methyltransferase (adenine-specific)